jgi:hypothetical protein
MQVNTAVDLFAEAIGDSLPDVEIFIQLWQEREGEMEIQLLPRTMIREKH